MCRVLDTSSLTCGAEGRSRWGSRWGSSGAPLCRVVIRRKNFHVLQRSPAGVLLGGGGGGLQGHRGGGERLHLLHLSFTLTPPSSSSFTSSPGELLNLPDVAAPLLTEDLVQDRNPVLRDREDWRTLWACGGGGDREEVSKEGRSRGRKEGR